MKRLTSKQAIELIKEEVDFNQLGTIQIRAILERVIPFSWHLYCKKHKLNPNILMDKHEIRIRRAK